jgi:RNA polymerase sigma factor (sigma-70 family)
MDDAECLQSYAANRSEEAFRELVRRHLNLVHGAALRQVGGDRHLAQDVTQRVFVVLARKAGGLKAQATIAGWLYNAARLEAAKAVRTERRRRIREEKAYMINLPDTDPPEELDWNRLSPLLDDAMAKLDEAERDAVLLRFFSGKSFLEVGQVFKLTEDAARKRVSRAVEKLRQILRQRGVASTAAALSMAISDHAATAQPMAFLNEIAGSAWVELTAGSATKAGIIMSLNKFAAVVAGAVIIASAGFVIRDASLLRSARNRETAIKAEIAAAARRENDLSQKRSALDRQLAQRETGQPVEKTGATDPKRLYLTDPAYQRLAMISALARHHLEFQRFYRKMNLSPDQIRRFEDTMVLQDQANFDAKVVTDNGGDPQTVYHQSGPQWSSEMKRLLGPDGFRQLQDYLRSRPVRAFVDSLVGDTAAIGEPLTVEQADQVGEIALANDATYKKGKGTDPGTVNWEDVWKPAAQVLSPKQLSMLQTTVRVWSLQRQIQQGLSAPRVSKK